MKRLYVLILLIALPLLVRSQGFDVTLKGMGKSTWLLNQNIAIQGDAQDYDSGWGHNYGLGFLFSLGENAGVGADLLVGRHTGDYIGTIDKVTYNSEVELKTVDVPVYFLLKSRNGFYFELGPQFSWIRDAVYSSEDTNGKIAEFSVNDEVEDLNIAAMAGFGFRHGLSDNIGLLLGFRFAYGITDLKGVDALGQSLSDRTLYPEHESTSSVFGALQLGLSYKFGDE